jgi:hypothetical protein
MRLFWPAWTAILTAAMLLPGSRLRPARPSPAFLPDTIAPHAVALLPIRIDSSIPNAVVGRRVMDSLIAATLEAAGYSLVAPAIAEPAWLRAVDSAGGYYDPATGAMLTEKLAAIRAAVTRQLGAGSLLRAHAGVMMLPYSNKKPLEYGGVSEMVATGSSGTVPALLLAISVSDSSGTVVQCGVAGIQLLEKGTVWNTRAHPVKPEKIFADTGRNAAAVRRALGGFLVHAPTCNPAPAP